MHAVKLSQLRSLLSSDNYGENIGGHIYTVTVMLPFRGTMAALAADVGSPPPLPSHLFLNFSPFIFPFHLFYSD